MKKRRKKVLRVGAVIRTTGIGSDLGIVKGMHQGRLTVKWLKAKKVYQEYWPDLKVVHGAKVVR